MNIEEIYAFLNKTQDGGPVAKALEAVIKAKDEDIKAKEKNIRTLNTKLKDAEGKVKPLEEKIAVFADVLGVDEDAEDLQAAPPTRAMGVTEILLFTTGTPNSLEISSPVSTRCPARVVIFS